MTYLGVVEYTGGYVEAYDVRVILFYLPLEKVFLLETHETDRGTPLEYRATYVLADTRKVSFYDFSKTVVIPHGEVRGCPGGGTCLCNDKDEYLRGIMRDYSQKVILPSLIKPLQLMRDLQGLTGKYMLVEG